MCDWHFGCTVKLREMHRRVLREGYDRAIVQHHRCCRILTRTDNITRQHHLSACKGFVGEIARSPIPGLELYFSLDIMHSRHAETIRERERVRYWNWRWRGADQREERFGIDPGEVQRSFTCILAA